MTDVNPTAPPASHVPGTPLPGSAPVKTPEADWTDQVTDLIVDSVDKVRSKTTGPILEISQAAVHAIVALLLLIPVLVLGLVGVVRLLDWAIPVDVWAIYAGLGMILVLIGVVLWRLRTPRTS